MIRARPTATKIDFAGLDHFDQSIEMLAALARAWRAKGFDEILLEADRADGDDGFARQLLRPAREVHGRAVEFRLPEATRRAVKDVDAGIGERGEPIFKGCGVCSKACSVVLLLPLRVAQDNGKVRRGWHAGRP